MRIRGTVLALAIAFNSAACFTFDLQLDAMGTVGPAGLALGESAWSPDGSSLVVGFPFLSSLPVRRFSLDGPSQDLAKGGYQCSWSPDGRWIAYVSGPAMGDLRVIAADGTERFTLGLYCWHVAWSPDGQWIAASTSAGHIVLVRSDGSGWRDVGPGSWATWSPDSTRLAFSTSMENQDGIDLLTVEDLQRIHLTKGCLPSWSPDGGSLAFSDGDSFYVIARDGSGRHVVALGSFPQWSPSGDRILLVRADPEPDETKQLYCTLLTVHPDGNDEHVLARTLFSGRWSPDGSKVAFLRGDLLGGGGLFVIDADGKDERLLGSIYP